MRKIWIVDLVDAAQRRAAVDDVELGEATGALLHAGAPVTRIAGADPDAGVAAQRFNGLGQV